MNKLIIFLLSQILVFSTYAMKRKAPSKENSSNKMLQVELPSDDILATKALAAPDTESEEPLYATCLEKLFFWLMNQRESPDIPEDQTTQYPEIGWSTLPAELRAHILSLAAYAPQMKEMIKNLQNLSKVDRTTRLWVEDPNFYAN